MKVVFLTSRYPPEVLGGGELSTKLIAEALVRCGLEVLVLAGAPQDATLEEQGVRIHRLRSLWQWWAKPLREARSALDCAKVVKQVLRSLPEMDILHAHDFRSALALAFVAHPCRVVTVRDFAPICGTTNNLWADGAACTGCTWPNVLFRCHRVAEASTIRKPFRVAQYKGNLSARKAAYHEIPHHLYTSVHLQERVRLRLGPPYPATCAVIGNPIDPSWISEPVPLGPWPHFLYAGRLETTKGTDILLAAVAHVHGTVPGIHLHLAGGGEVARYKRLAERLGIQSAMTFHGPVPPARVRDLIDASRAVVSPHIWEEPFGRVALEAGARGRALITSDRGGTRETTTAETALRIPAGNVAALAAALRRLAEQPATADTLGFAARRFVTARFASSVIAQQHRAYYETLREAARRRETS